MGSPSTRYGHAGISHPLGLLSVSHFLPSHLIFKPAILARRLPFLLAYSGQVLCRLWPPLPLGILPLALAYISPLTKTPDSFLLFSQLKILCVAWWPKPAGGPLCSGCALLMSHLQRLEMIYQLMIEAVHLHWGLAVQQSWLDGNEVYVSTMTEPSIRVVPATSLNQDMWTGASLDISFIPLERKNMLF